MLPRIPLRSAALTAMLALALPPPGRGSAAVATSAPKVAFPLAKSADGRHLVDRRGEPFLIKLICAWGLMVRLSEADAGRFFDAIAAKGFNAAMIRVICKHQYVQEGRPDWNGVSPFLTEWDFSRPNPDYFAHVDRIVRLAQDRGLLLFLVPAYLGSAGPDPKNRSGDQGWWDELQHANNSVAKSRAYGEFLGRRYRDAGNIVWVAGGDHNGLDGRVLGDGTVKPHQLAIIEGIREQEGARTRHLWTAHWKPKPAFLFSLENPDFAPYLDLDGFYVTNEAQMRARGPQYRAQLERYPLGTLMFHLDQAYEMDFQVPDTKDYQWIRRKNYGGLLSGLAGTCFSPGRDTMPNGGCLMQFADGWEPLVGLPAGRSGGTRGMQEAMLCFDLFTPLAWHRLVPDLRSELVTAGRGTYGHIDYACAARTDDGTLALVYVPTRRTITIAMSALAGGDVDAQWFDPTTGACSPVDGAIRGGAGAAAREFSTPAEPHAGDQSSDWILVLKAASRTRAPGGKS